MEQHHPGRLPGNVPGKFFTTEDCDGCAYCASVAPDHFDYDKSTNTYFVARQPHGGQEEEAVLEAMDDCPLDAIRSENGNSVGVRHDAIIH